MDKTVSILIPIYNAERHLPACFGSILEQTYTNFEVILIVDGATDNSLAICREYAEEDKRFKVIHQINQGVASARNAGLNAALGEYIVFLDPDDFWNASFLSRMIQSLDLRNVPICNLIKKTVHGTEISCPPVVLDCNNTSALSNQNISCCRCIFNRNIIEEFNLRFTVGRRTGEDLEFTYKYMMHCHSFCFVPDAIYYYVIHTNSAMHTSSYAHFDAIDALQSVINYAKNICSTDELKMHKLNLIQHNALRIIEFSVTTLLTTNTPPKDILKYMQNNGYMDLMSKTLKEENHYHSTFIKLWQISPNLCLYCFSLRKSLGRLLRKIGLRK